MVTYFMSAAESTLWGLVIETEPIFFPINWPFLNGLDTGGISVNF